MEKRSKPTYDIIIPVYHPDRSFEQVLKLLKQQEPAPEKIILLETLEEGEKLTPYGGCITVPVPKESFDHAATRQLGVSYSDAEAFLCMTQDAEPRDTELCKKLLEGLYPSRAAGRQTAAYEKTETAGTPDPRPIAMCYARQIAKNGSSEAERFGRSFNYPEESRCKSIADVPALGIKTFFASNVCCAYDRALFDRLGGFVPDAIFNEDMLYAAKAVKQGCRVAYAAEAVVIHSHKYTAMQQFHRMFDNGMSQAMHPEVFEGIKSEGEGLRLVRETAAHLLKTGHPFEIFPFLWQSAFKYAGFRMGKKYKTCSYEKLYRRAMNKTYIDRHFRMWGPDRISDT